MPALPLVAPVTVQHRTVDGGCAEVVFDALSRNDAGPVKATRRDPIHRQPPAFTDQSTTAEIFETGMKVIDLICPFLKGGKAAVFGGAGVTEDFGLAEAYAHARTNAGIRQ